jgi:thiol-disulfide isomerase/thioredoxin
MTGPKMPRARAMREEMKRKEARRKQLTIAGAVVGVVVLVVVIMVVVKVTGGGSKNDKTTSASGSVASNVTTVPATVLAKAGDGGASPPKKITDQPALTSNGKPEMLYFGAEWCPFCAAQRWPMAVALSRFGTLKGLGQTHSRVDDTPSNIPTLSFSKSTYTSKYLTFTPVETQDTNGKTLTTPTKEQNDLVSKLDTPKYVGGQGSGSIPFITYGNKYVSSGSSYDPTILGGKSHAAIASDIHSGSGTIGKTVDGAANVITATICEMTGNKPANVCTVSAITTIQKNLGGN